MIVRHASSSRRTSASGTQASECEKGVAAQFTRPVGQRLETATSGQVAEIRSMAQDRALRGNLEVIPVEHVADNEADSSWSSRERAQE